MEIHDLLSKLTESINQTIKNEVKAQLQNQSKLDNLMNKRKTCNYLGISNNTLDSWIKQGLPVIRIGKTVRFDKKEVHRWLNKHKNLHCDLL
ncbi:helix-turn-helix protein [Streptococcus pneumoniae]|nr:helix-turn-helix protein [Streptococcus pneumoniae]